MRGIGALAVMQGAVWGAATTIQVPGWLPVVLSLLGSGAAFRWYTVRLEKRMLAATASKTEAQAARELAETQEIVQRRVNEHLVEMREQVSARKADAADAQARWAAAQSELAATMARATQDRMEMRREIADLEERVHTLTVRLAEKSDELDTLRAQLGDKERRTGSDRRD